MKTLKKLSALALLISTSAIANPVCDELEGFARETMINRQTGMSIPAMINSVASIDAENEIKSLMTNVIKMSGNAKIEESEADKVKAVVKFKGKVKAICENILK